MPQKLLTEEQRAKKNAYQRLYRAANREAFRGYTRKWRDANPGVDAESSRAARATVRQRLQDIKTASGCVECGFNAHPAALDFNHRNPLEKEFTLSKEIWHPWEVIEVEIAKCDILCANCHRIHTYNNKHHAPCV